jgi:hypothetical protein
MTLDAFLKELPVRQCQSHSILKVANTGGIEVFAALY